MNLFFEKLKQDWRLFRKISKRKREKKQINNDYRTGWRDCSALRSHLKSSSWVCFLDTCCGSQMPATPAQIYTQIHTYTHRQTHTTHTFTHRYTHAHSMDIHEGTQQQKSRGSLWIILEIQHHLPYIRYKITIIQELDAQNVTYLYKGYFLYSQMEEILT